jgi:hypothetical protein
MSRTILASSLLLVLSAFALRAQPIAVGGSVRGPDGKALPGAAVELVSLGAVEPAAHPALPPAAQGTSDATGAFRLQASEAGLFKVRVSARGCAPVETDLIPLLEPVELPPLDLALAAPAIGTFRRAGASVPPVERSAR